MNFIPRALFSAALVLIVSGAYAAMPLDPYLLRPDGRPAECHETQGFYPVNPKVDLFYEYKTYRVALPPVLERHAQSLECGAQKGTLYFFAYQDADQAEMAERFARSVLTGPTPSLKIEAFPKGFVILSFSEMPVALREALNRKIHPADHNGVAAEPAAVSTPRVVAPGAVAAAVLPTPPVVPPPTASAPPPPAATPVPSEPPGDHSQLGARSSSLENGAGGEPDLSDEFLKKVQKALDCKKDLDPDVSEACKLIQAFKSGKPVDLIIAAPSARLGEAIRISDLGQIRNRFYNVAVGNGRQGEIAIYPLQTETGVQEIEAKALVECRRDGKALPAENELTGQIAKMNRPDHPVAFPTQGRSQVLHLGGRRKIYIRRSGEQWVLISVNPNPVDLLDSTDLVIAGLY